MINQIETEMILPIMIGPDAAANLLIERIKLEDNKCSSEYKNTLVMAIYLAMLAKVRAICWELRTATERDAWGPPEVARYETRRGATGSVRHPSRPRPSRVGRAAGEKLRPTSFSSPDT